MYYIINILKFGFQMLPPQPSYLSKRKWCSVKKLIEPIIKRVNINHNHNVVYDYNNRINTLIFEHINVHINIKVLEMLIKRTCKNEIRCFSIDFNNENLIIKFYDK